MANAMSAIEGKAESVKTCGHFRVCDPKRKLVLSSGSNGSDAVPRLHLLVSIDKKVVEILDANQAEPRILHVRNSVECNR